MKLRSWELDDFGEHHHHHVHNTTCTENSDRCVGDEAGDVSALVRVGRERFDSVRSMALA